MILKLLSVSQCYCRVEMGEVRGEMRVEVRGKVRVERRVERRREVRGRGGRW